MFASDIAAIAQAHNVTADELSGALVRGGWDFSKLDEKDAAHVDFATRLVTDYAVRIVELKAKKAEAEARVAARRLASKTTEAKANPALECGRCDGKGHIRGFCHIDNGKCFACHGAGIIRRRRR